MSRLSRSFYARPTRQLAQALLGCVLVHRCDGHTLSGRIVETEAYIGETDLACHARAGRTARTAVMYGRPGLAYVYFTYGVHWLFNVVCEREDFPAAVLIRALEPLTGVAVMQAQRPAARSLCALTNGPAKLCQALRIEGTLNGVDLCDPHSALWLEAGERPPTRSVGRGPRVGLGQTPEPWLSKPWRYWIDEHPCVSPG